MKVSIIIPVYNVASYIVRCLQSVAAQTYHDIECILIDDCGTDNSMELAGEFIGNYKGDISFHIIRQPENQGPSAARNTGLGQAIGEYIYYMDSDDAITPDCIEHLANLAKKYPDADYIQGEIVTGGDNLMTGSTDADVPEFCDDKELLEEIILNKTHRTACYRLSKHSFLTDNNLLFPVGLIMEDHCWTYFLSKHARAVAFSHKGTYYYYNNQNSIVNTSTKKSYIKKYTSYMTIANIIVNDLLQEGNIRSCHRRYIGETIVFCMNNLPPIHSLHHWSRFWKFTCVLSYKLRKHFHWRMYTLLLCTLPPLCFLSVLSGWRWRLRQYLVAKL